MTNVSNHKTLIYLVPYPITPSCIEKFGFNIMRDQGIDFQVFELSAFAPRNHPNAKYDTLLNETFIKKIKSLKEFEQCIKSTAHHSFYVDCINGMNGLLWDSRKIFNILKKYAAQYYIVEIGPLPVLSIPRKKSQLFSRVLNKLKAISNLSQFIKSVQIYSGKKYLAYFAKRNHGYQLPYKIFSVDNDICKNYLARYNLPNETRISIHSLDYDRYLTFMKNNNNVKTEKICVFIDQAMTHHPELSKKMGLDRPVTHENYMRSMNQFFSKLEELTGLRVVIAAHPASRYQDYQDAFEGREIIKNKTIEIIAKSELLLTHNSTAISYGILFDKQIALLATNEQIQTGFDRIIKKMADSLNVPMICIDHNFSRLALKEYATWKKDYDHYLYSYIKAKETPNKMIWETVAEEVKNNATL